MCLGSVALSELTGIIAALNYKKIRSPAKRDPLCLTTVKNTLKNTGKHPLYILDILWRFVGNYKKIKNTFAIVSMPND